MFDPHKDDEDFSNIISLFVLFILMAFFIVVCAFTGGI